MIPKFFLLDVDGVMTSGHFIYSIKGKQYKIFGPDDHDALKLLKKFIKIEFVSSDLKGFSISKKRIKDDMEFSKIIELARNLANKNNSKFHFVYLPSYERYAGQYNDQEYNFIKKNINDLNINFIDIDKEVFKKENDPLKLFPFKLSGHYTIEGYRKVTEAIYNKVQ